MAVSFYRLGVTPRLLSYGTRKFERGVSEEPDDIIIHYLLCHCSSHAILSYLILYLYRDYSQSWSTSGCVRKADCDSPGYATQATCCAAHFGGQTGGACNPNNGKFYADYATDAAIAINDLSSDNNDGRELLSAWCDPATPVLWHP